MKRYFSVFRSSSSSNKDRNFEKNPRMEEIDSATTSREPAPSDEADSTHDPVSANGKTYRRFKEEDEELERILQLSLTEK